jgi:hypothetical protein
MDIVIKDIKELKTIVENMNENEVISLDLGGIDGRKE